MRLNVKIKLKKFLQQKVSFLENSKHYKYRLETMNIKTNSNTDFFYHRKIK